MLLAFLAACGEGFSTGGTPPDAAGAGPAAGGSAPAAGAGGAGGASTSDGAGGGAAAGGSGPSAVAQACDDWCSKLESLGCGGLSSCAQDCKDDLDHPSCATEAMKLLECYLEVENCGEVEKECFSEALAVAQQCGGVQDTCGDSPCLPGCVDCQVSCSGPWSITVSCQADGSNLKCDCTLEGPLGAVDTTTKGCTQEDDLTCQNNGWGCCQQEIFN